MKAAPNPGSSQWSVETGAYQLVLYLKRPQTIWVGKRLGYQLFPAGYYAYTGSAMGSGGIAARVRRHVDKSKITRHWHIDYLTTDPKVEVVDVICWPSRSRQECKINQGMEALPDASVPIPWFGNSDRNKSRDCTCSAHLVHFARRPSASRSECKSKPFS